MTKIAKHIEQINNSGRKALSIYLTAGFPAKENFVDLALNVLDNGADMLELGIPFSDPLADGPVIQASSQAAIENGVSLKDVFYFCEKIKSKTEKPIILMGYANPVVKYGAKSFCKDALDAGAEGLIIPDVPLEEYDSFYSDDFKNFEKILLTTPTSSDERIKTIDNKSEGFVYCVTVTGTTGARDNFRDDTIKNIERTYSLISKNKMMIGFGISKPEHIKTFAPHCDGVIVASALIKKMEENANASSLMEYINSLSEACKI
jgi:tryptophan synthase alpha chain